MSLKLLRCKAVPHDAKLKDFEIIGSLQVAFVWNEKTCRNEIVLLSEMRFILYKYNCEIVFFPGFRCDGGSVPKAFWSAVSDPYSTRFLLAFFLHDGLYAAELFTRSECDWIFLELMRELGVSWRKRNEVWAAVRMGGWWVWLGHMKTIVNENRKLIMKVPCRP
ncbi:MAG: hypothetical protein A2017_06620 [Lentisphaerae bacterium GWF2_44_16]|nr:MAG: hypothetical protein A2017_06620 [Lentisphaerae bacterium GWF2_44_16]